MDAARAGWVSGEGLALHAVGEVLCSGPLHTVWLFQWVCCSGPRLLSPASVGHVAPTCVSHHSVPGPGGMHSPRSPAPSGTSPVLQKVLGAGGSQHVQGVRLCCSSAGCSRCWQEWGTPAWNRSEPPVGHSRTSRGIPTGLCVPQELRQSCAHGWTLLVARTAALERGWAVNPACLHKCWPGHGGGQGTRGRASLARWCSGRGSLPHSLLRA